MRSVSDNRKTAPTATTGETARLLVSFELSQSKWVLTVRAPASSKAVALHGSVARHGEGRAC